VLARLVGPVPPPTPELPTLDGHSGDAGAGAARMTALAPGLLQQTLEARAPSAAMEATERALLERFGRTPPGLGPRATNERELEASLDASGLETTAFDGGSLALLRRLDHPVALALQVEPVDEAEAAAGDARGTGLDSATGPLYWVAVVGFESDRIRIIGLLDDREVSVPIAEFARHWIETGILVWERFERIPEILSYNDQGGSVVWLQRSLGDLNFHLAEPTGLFDDATVASLKRFQRDRGLIDDGIAGPLTQIALFAELDQYPVPRLSAAVDTQSTAITTSPPSNRSPSPSPPPTGRGERG
jgi:hypothetical protein